MDINYTELLKPRFEELTDHEGKVFLMEKYSNTVYSEHDSKYETIKNLKVGEKYLKYSFETPSYNIIDVYEVVDKLIDENRNVLILIKRIDEVRFGGNED